MHVEHLKTDPDAIEYEAHTRLRYTRRDQVIVLNETAAPNAASGHVANSPSAANSVERRVAPQTETHR
jgi:hypothetical protein